MVRDVLKNEKNFEKKQSHRAQEDATASAYAGKQGI